MELVDTKTKKGCLTDEIEYDIFSNPYTFNTIPINMTNTTGMHIICPLNHFTSLHT